MGSSVNMDVVANRKIPSAARNQIPGIQPEANMINAVCSLLNGSIIFCLLNSSRHGVSERSSTYICMLYVQLVDSRLSEKNSHVLTHSGVGEFIPTPIMFCNLPNPSGHTRPVIEMSARSRKILFLGTKVTLGT